MVINVIVHSTVQNTTENVEHFKHIHAHSIIFCFVWILLKLMFGAACCTLLALSLGPSPLIRGLVLIVCAFVKFPVIVFVKSFCALTFSVCGDCTNQKYGVLIL